MRPTPLRRIAIRLLATSAFCAPAPLFAQSEPIAPVDDAEYRMNYGLGMTDALSANQAGFTGAGVTVAIVDSGLDVLHPEFAGRISEAARNFGGDQPPRDLNHAVDRDGTVAAHGTHVAGIIGAARDGVDREGNMQGVAYEATLLPLRAVGVTEADPGRDATNDAIRYAARQGAQVLNGSFGWPTLEKYTVDAEGNRADNPGYVEFDFTPIYGGVDGLADTYAALKTALDADVVMVFAAGNEYVDQPRASVRAGGDGGLPLLTPETIADGTFRLVRNSSAKGFDINDGSTYEWYEADDPEIADIDFSEFAGKMITVVAVGQNGQIASYSERCGEAAAWCLAAPGGDWAVDGDKGIVSTWQVAADTGANPLYKYDQGTSMAAPHVSGAAALVRQAFPYMDARQTIETILTTATEIGPGEIYGQGLLNVGAAVKGPMELRYQGVFDVDTGGATSTWSNAITGVGDLTKRGAGTLVLAGDNSYEGATTVLGGTLAVAGRVTSETRVRDGGVLAGTGTLGAVVAGAGGIVAPGAGEAGAGIGRLTVEGDFTQGAGSVYRADLDEGARGDADRIDVTGTATIDEGATLVLATPEEGDAPELGERYTLLTAAGGVDGTYGTLAGDLTEAPFVGYALGTDADALYVEFARNELAFAALAATPNARAAAGGAESLGAGDALYDEILYLDAETAAGAFSVLAGEIHASARTVLVNDGHFLRGAVTDRLRAAFDGVAAPAAPVFAFGPQGADYVPATTEQAVFWARGYGAKGRIEGDDVARVETSTGGFFLGADMPVGDRWRVGAVLGYDRVDFDESAASGKADNYQLGLYAGARWDRVAVRTGLAYATSKLDTDRSVDFGDVAETLTADYDARTFQAFGEVGYRVDTPAAALEPYAALAYLHLRTDGFDESGGAAALSAGAESSGTAFSTLGLRAARELALEGATARLRGEIGWRYAFGDVTPESRLAFAGGDAFDVTGAPIARNAALVAAGIDMEVNARATLGLAYQGQFASDAQENGVTATLAIRF
ncbi:MAG: hypothetical protein DI556_06885 [Rhodovulum sulfidophilum]|uniref:Autotransporter domain-containing protein n=1 Tax=Rhodovulum sulfidophilum TaxID=35806 RepID=A0A2W5NCM3_RHOSU|nr:MAG: hypothetical protein DI556_06885 [Rhodovulum sulfidophilum]